MYITKGNGNYILQLLSFSKLNCLCLSTDLCLIVTDRVKVDLRGDNNPGPNRDSNLVCQIRRSTTSLKG